MTAEIIGTISASKLLAALNAALTGVTLTPVSGSEQGAPAQLRLING